MPEEFKWLGQDKKTRGARQDEAIEIIRLLLGGGMVEFHGKYYDFDRLIMAPVPKKRIPIYVGGTTTPALRRAARHGDGWVSVIHGMDEVPRLMAEMRGYLKVFGRENEPFDIMMHCPDAETVDDIRRLEDMGITDLQVTPWSEKILAEMGVGAIMQQQPSLQVKQDAIKRYADEVIAKFA
jgi:alkanesulfonate monooxygenase SsuD/methylene tetrahydromethanopterin reductase-like flavin-dependent oxidoreductase (luciferase family)